MTNGAARLWEAAVASGVSVCFTNPGTTEMPLVAALDEVDGMRSVLCLFEGVATGAADGYARVTGRPATTLLHLGPGLGNGIANLHNARRAGSPIVNLVGDHPTWHIAADSPLTSDIVSLASPVSAWVHTIPTAGSVAGDTVEAIRRAYGPPRGISTLIVPIDCQWDDAPGAVPPLTLESAGVAEDERLERAATMLRRGPASVLFVGGPALEAAGLEAIERIRAATDCRVYTEMFSTKIDRGRHLPWFRSLPYFSERALEALADTEALVAAGTRPPVAFFANPDMSRSELTPPGCDILALDEPAQDVVASLEALADLLGAPPVAVAPREPVDVPSDGDLTAATVGQAVVALLPEHAYVIDEAATSAFGYTTKSTYGPAHTTFGLTGGAIGMGLPLAVGAGVGAQDGRRVVVLQADGSGLYTSQALWTMAHERLDVTVVVYANHKYAILQHELARAGHPKPGPNAADLTNLSDPEISYSALATAMGVPATRATTTGEFVEQLRTALGTPGPNLVEAVI